MAIKSKPCKECGSIYHTAMFHKPKKPLKRSPLKKTAVKPKKKAVKRVVSRSQLVKNLDSVFSQYIRLRDARELNGEWQAMCVTSGEWKHWKNQQAGHFFTRGRYATRWDETNVHVQSYRDNVLLKGNYIVYTRWMIDKYGREYVDELERKSLTQAKFSRADLEEKIEEYKRKVKELWHD